MTSHELSHLLVAELKQRNWTVSKLAEEAQLPYETARRAVRGIGQLGLGTTTKLLVAVGHDLVPVPQEIAP